MTANDHTFGLIATSISIPVQVIVLSGGWAWIGVAIMAKAITTHLVIVLCIAQSPVGSLPRGVQGVPIRTCRQERGFGHYHGTDANNLALAFLTRYLLALRKYRIELRF